MKRLIVITGATACGKTAVSIKVAQLLNTEIVSCDSRQFYKEMFIGTARPSADEMQNVKHHFIASHSVTDELNAGQFERQAIPLLDKLFEKYDNVILTGGSGLFIDAVLNGFDKMPTIKPGIREELNHVFQNKGIETLYNQLLEKDPEYAKTVDKENSKRIIRALEICNSTNKTYSELRIGRKAKRNFTSLQIVLDRPREELYNRINLRVDLMMKAGLEAEVKSLISHRDLNTLKTVGYREIFQFLDGEITKERAIELIKQNSRRYAKRQLTWFRRDSNYHWVTANDFEQLRKLLNTDIVS